MQWLQKIAKNNRYHSVINRGYYMATRRYKISLRVLKNISQVSTVNEWNILDKADTSNLSQRFMQNFLLDAIFSEQ